MLSFVFNIGIYRSPLVCIYYKGAFPVKTIVVVQVFDIDNSIFEEENNCICVRWRRRFEELYIRLLQSFIDVLSSETSHLFLSHISLCVHKYTTLKRAIFSTKGRLFCEL